MSTREDELDADEDGGVGVVEGVLEVEVFGVPKFPLLAPKAVAI